MRTRSSTGSLPSKRTTGVDVNSGGNDNTQNIALEGEGAAANSRNNNNNDSDNEHHGDDAEDNESSSRQLLRRTSSRQSAKRVQSYYSDDDDDNDDDDDDGDDDDDTSNMSDGSAKPKKKGRKKTRSLAATATLYNPTNGWVWTFAPGNKINAPPAMIVKRTKLFYQFGMDDPDKYGSVAKWREFREKAAEKGLFTSDTRYAKMKTFYNQGTEVKKGEYPNRPLPHFKSPDEVSMARVYLHHSGSELIKKVKELNEFAKQNGQDVLIIPTYKDCFAVKRLRELAERGDPTAIEWLDFYLALDSLRVCASNNPDGSAAQHLLDMLKKIGYKDHSSFRDYEQEQLEHCHRLFLCATIGEENIGGELRQIIDPEGLTAQIKQAEESDYFVEALVCDEIKVLTFDFSKKLYDGNEVEVEELYGRHLLSKGECDGRGWVKVVGKDGIPKCADCGKASYICISLDHDGPGAVHVKSLRGGKNPFECSEKELKLQEKLFAIEREKGKRAYWRKRCCSCHAWKDTSTIARIIAGEIDRKSEDAGAWKYKQSAVAKMNAIHSSRILSHKNDAWSGEKLEKINSCRDHAHHVTASFKTALNDLVGGGLWTLDTAKRPYEDSSFMRRYPVDKLIQRQARRNAVTSSTNSNYHKILHTTIHLVELGLLNGGILPWEIRGGYFIVPVSPSVNSSLFKILVDNRSSFDEIDRDKVMSAPRQSFRGGYVLKELETDYSDNDAAQDGDDDRVHAEFEHRRGDDDEDGNSEQIGRPNTASGDYTIIDDTEMTGVEQQEEEEQQMEVSSSSDAEVVGSDDIEEGLTKDAVEASLSSDANMNEDDMDMGGVMADDVPHRSETTSLQLAADNSKVTELEAAMAEMAETIAKLKTEKEAAIEAMKKSEQTNNEQRGIIDSLTAKNASLESDITTLTNKMENLKFEDDKKSSTIDSLTTAKDEEMAALEVAHAAAMSAKDEEMASLIEQMETMKREHDQTIESMEAEHSTHVARLEAAHRVEMKKMKRERDQTVVSMEAEHSTHVARLTAAHRGKMEEMEREHDQTIESMEVDHNTHVAGLKAAHRKEKDELTTTIDNLENAVYFYERKKEILQNEISVLMEEVDISASELEVARDRISELEDDNTVLMEEVDISASELVAARGRIGQLEDDNSNLRETHDETKETLSELQSSRAVQLISMVGLCNPLQPNKKRRLSDS